MNSVAQYQTIHNQLMAEISSGLWLAGEKLPSERELSVRFQTTRITVREALLQLEFSGVIYRLNRRGWFVAAPRLLYNPKNSANFNEYACEQGRLPHTELLSVKLRTASETDVAQLQMAQGARLYVLQRRRSLEGQPVLLECIRVNAGLCPDIDQFNLDRSLTEIMANHYDIRISRSRMHMYPTVLDAEQARLLQVMSGAPAMFISQSRYDQNNRLVEYTQEIWRHDVLEVTLDQQY